MIVTICSGCGHEHCGTACAKCECKVFTARAEAEAMTPRGMVTDAEVAEWAKIGWDEQSAMGRLLADRERMLALAGRAMKTASWADAGAVADVARKLLEEAGRGD